MVYYLWCVFIVYNYVDNYILVMAAQLAEIYFNYV